MARRKEPVIPDAIIDQLLAGADAKTAFDQNGLLDQLKKALTERALKAELDHHLTGDENGNRLAAGFPQKSVHTLFGAMPLPTPDRRPAHPGLPRDLQNRKAIRRKQHDPSTLDMLEGTIAITDDGGQARAIFGSNDNADFLGHAPRIAWPRNLVNLFFASVH